MNEAIVYFVVSRERGPEERIFKEEDVQAEGGVHALEILLEKQSYWFVQLGEVRGELGPYGLIFPIPSSSSFPRLLRMRGELDGAIRLSADRNWNAVFLK